MLRPLGLAALVTLLAGCGKPPPPGPGSSLAVILSAVPGTQKVKGTVTWGGPPGVVARWRFFETNAANEWVPCPGDPGGTPPPPVPASGTRNFTHDFGPGYRGRWVFVRGELVVDGTVIRLTDSLAVRLP